MLGILLAGGFVSGALLGQVFRVFVLVPASILAIVSAVVVSLRFGYSLPFGFLAVVAMVTSVQAGYFVGIIARQPLGEPKNPRKASQLCTGREGSSDLGVARRR